LEQNTFSYAINFYIVPPIPVGAYKVEIYFNGILNTAIDFTVQ